MKFTGILALSLFTALQTQAQAETITVVIKKGLFMEPIIQKHLVQPSQEITINSEKDEVTIQLITPSTSTLELIENLKSNNMLLEAANSNDSTANSIQLKNPSKNQQHYKLKGSGLMIDKGGENGSGGGGGGGWSGEGGGKNNLTGQSHD